MTFRRWSTTAIAVAAFLALSQPVAAYHFFYVSSGASRLPVAWRSLPVTVTIDMDPVSFRTTAQNAMNAWNAVTTANDIFGTPAISAVNYTGANFGTAWGVSGDGRFDIVCDADGSALTALGLDSGSVTGYAPTDRSVVGGQGAITDGFLIINCSLAEGATINYQATSVHELGHAIGLAHSATFLDDAERLRPFAKNDAPTMYPFTLPTQSNKSSLEFDDIAAVSELYPGPTFTASYGTISGIVTRCGSDDPVLGVNVRAVPTSGLVKNQISRYTGFDGNTTGYYEMKVPPGTYNLIIEVMSLPQNRMAMQTRVDNDFSTEYRSADADENNCTEDQPDTPTNISVASPDLSEGDGSTVVRGLTGNQNFKTNPIELAFVVDDTGSMGNEIAAVRAILTAQIARVRADTTRPFPNTAIVTFKDSVTVRRISRDPDQLQAMVNTLAAGGGGDCPEWSNDALLTAGRMLRRGGRAVLFTDADSHSTRATREQVAELYRSKSLRMDPLLSGTCSGTGFDPRGEGGASQMDPALSQNPGEPVSDEFPPEGTLGNQSSIETNSAIALATGGVIVAIPGIKTGSTVERDRYINTGTNIAVSATLPTVSVLTPGDGARGATFDVELRGSNTNFQSSSVVAFAGTGITVNSQAVQSATSLLLNVTVAGDATLGFRDVTVTTALGGGALETATGVGAFNIVAAPTIPTIVSVSPSIGTRGRTSTVTIRGIATNFTNASVPLFCTSSVCSTGGHDARIVINSVSAASPTTLVVTLTVGADATVSYRNVSVVTGAETARENAVGPFLVTAAPLVLPSIVSVTPSVGNQGETLTLSVVAENTTFVNGVSALSFSGTGITVNSTTVTSPTTATANITIVPGATPGFRDVFVTTGGETAALLNAFNVLGGPPTAMPATAFQVISIVGNTLTFRWTPPLAGLAPTDYVIEGGINPGETLAAIATGGTAPVFSVTAPSGAFYVRVHTISGTSRSPASNEIRVFLNTPTVPSAPANFLASVSGDALALGWRNTYTGGVPAAMQLDVSGPVTASLALPFGENASFSGVPPGTYTLALRATNAAGASTASAPVTITVPSACTGAPQAPSAFTAYLVGNVISVLWNPPTSGTAAIGYQLSVTGAFDLTVPTTGRSLSGAVPSGTYNLSVRAVNACGTSPATSVQTIVVP